MINRVREGVGNNPSQLLQKEKMKKNQIKISKNENGKTQHLTEVLPEIQTNTILHKTLTGLGATYGELKAKRNSIIIEPNKPVIIGKCKDPKHTEDNLFGVYEGVYTDDIVKYIEKSGDKFLKIMTTPESFTKVQRAFEEVDIDIRFTCFLLFDECHKLIMDSDYRENISLPMDLFFECKNKALVTATPLEYSNPKFKEQGFQVIEIEPTFEYKQPLNLFTTNCAVKTLRKALEWLQQDPNPIFVFCNSTDTIYSAMKQLGYLDNSAVFCSDKSVDKLKQLHFKSAYAEWKPQKMKRVNWLTSRFYNALDIEISDRPNVVMFTDCYFAEFTMIDPFTDTIQIVGRFRNGVQGIYHITNTKASFPHHNNSKAVVAYVKFQEMIYRYINQWYNRTRGIVSEALLDIRSTMPYNRWLDKDGNKNHFAIDNYVNEEMMKTYYRGSEYLLYAYQHTGAFVVQHRNFIYPIGDLERLQRECSGLSVQEKRKIIVNQLELLGETEADMEFKHDLMASDAFIVEAYDVLGKDELERLDYRMKPIREAMIVKQHQQKAKTKDVVRLVNNSFDKGRWYSSRYIKEKLESIYKKMDIPHKRAITAQTIKEYFDVKEWRKSNERGYLLIQSKYLTDNNLK